MVENFWKIWSKIIGKYGRKFLENMVKNFWKIGSKISGKYGRKTGSGSKLLKIYNLDTVSKILH